MDTARSYPDTARNYPETARSYPGDSIPLKTAKLFKGQVYGSLRSEFRLRKLLKQPLVVNSHRKWNHHDGSAPLARLRINRNNSASLINAACRSSPIYLTTK